MSEPRTEALRTVAMLEAAGFSDDEQVRFLDTIEAAGLTLLPKREAATPPEDVDVLAQIIREEDGDHSLGAGALAERIAARLAQQDGTPRSDGPATTGIPASPTPTRPSDTGDSAATPPLDVERLARAIEIEDDRLPFLDAGIDSTASPRAVAEQIADRYDRLPSNGGQG